MVQIEAVFVFHKKKTCLRWPFETHSISLPIGPPHMAVERQSFSAFRAGSPTSDPEAGRRNSKNWVYGGHMWGFN